jgi:flavin reductase (DIM6/NTAB) family NADH-FMN oxidoreductase RutF
MNEAAVSFREALSRFASGVVIVTAHTPAGLMGFTASAFASVSLEPPLVLVCVGKRASTHAGIVEAPHFGVSVLHAKQAWVADQFAHRQGVERFAGVPLRATASVPIVEGALAELVCSRHALHDAGDHTILVGRVLECRSNAGRPLVHYARTFGGFVAEHAPRQNGARSLPNGEGA